MILNLALLHLRYIYIYIYIYIEAKYWLQQMKGYLLENAEYLSYSSNLQPLLSITLSYNKSTKKCYSPFLHLHVCNTFSKCQSCEFIVLWSIKPLHSPCPATQRVKVTQEISATFLWTFLFTNKLGTKTVSFLHTME